MSNLLKRYPKVLYQKIKEWLHVSNYQKLIRPYICGLYHLGQFPYDTSLSSTKLDKRNFIEALVWLIYLSVAHPLMVYKMNHKENVRSSLVLHAITFYVFGVLCHWITLTSARSKLLLFQKISLASRVLPEEIFCWASKWMYSIDILRMILLGSYILDVRHDTVMFAIIVLNIYIFIVVTIVTTLFMNCIYVLYLCFREINRSLKKLQMSLATDEPHLLRRVYHSQKNPTLLSELKMLRRQHLEFSSIIDASNETFGLEIILIIGLIIIDITFNLYYYLTNNVNDGKIVELWSQKIVYMTYNNLTLIWMALVAEKVKINAKNIGINIHRILAMTFDEEISAELELFSMQVLQQKNTISAKGLVIDMTLITKVVGLMTTYLLLLIQFLFPKSC